MYESQPQEQSKKVRRSWTMAVTGVGLFFGGLLVGRMLFPMEIAKPFIVERRVEVPVEKLVEKIVYVERVVEKKVFGVPPEVEKWRQLSKGMSRAQVRSILGEPRRVEAISGYFEKWGYDRDPMTAYVTFGTSGRFPDTLDKLEGWREP